MTDDERDRTLRIILARCGDVLSERDIARLVVASDDEMIPGHIVMEVMTVLDRMSERLAVYEAKFAEAEPIPARLH
jgi:hypothetical protein